jgi:hypothetical protein
MGMSSGTFQKTFNQESLLKAFQFNQFKISNPYQNSGNNHTDL